MKIDWKAHYLEKYVDIIQMCNDMPISELIKYQHQLELYSISFKHKIISAEVLKDRYEKSLKKLETQTFKIQ